MLTEKELAEKFKVPIFDDITHFAHVQEQIALVPYLFAKQKGILPLTQTESGVVAALCDPLNLEALEELRFLLKTAIHPVFCTQEALDIAIEKCYQQKEEETKRFFSDLGKGEKTISKEEGIEGYDLLEQGDQNPVIRMVNTILLEAIQQGASDIHFEPVEEGVSVRYRIDGVLLKRHTPPREYAAQLLTRIKVMAKMDIAEHRLPQDGRIKLRQGGKEIDFRVSTLPILHGERIVLRILDKGNVQLGLDKIGIDPEVLIAFRKVIQMPEGIILVTGPTGSGKTTTLYSAIHELINGSINIITIEDPVEYKLGGISQMNVNPRIELDFAKGLRHILRQDPDVILVGEIRDKETAEIAIQASLTGHLVFSTLHTNDAPSAMTRLADMGIEPYLLASSVLGVLAQRLVRTICPECKASYVPAGEELAELGMRKESGLKFYKGVGCPHWFETGYKGRSGIYEWMPLLSSLKTQILKSPDAQELRKLAIETGMRSLFEKGLDLVRAGVTTSEELLRVTRMEQE
ncbi:MAG: type II secretion system ATPase GspE [Chlamydiia bacterium]|nr:type II secretion system ATPase GspE [Chlamydiia bacterium]